MDAGELSDLIVTKLVESGKVMVAGVEVMDSNNVVIDIVVEGKHGSITIDLS